MQTNPVQNSKHALLATLSCALVASSSLAAQDNDERVVQLAPFTITADGAQSVLHITERDLSQRQANDLEDALSLDPSVTVGGSTGVAQKIYVRNIGEGALNVSVDGASQSGALFHHIGRISVEPDLLKQVEVQPGVGNASDGPGALGGAIRFITKDPIDLLGPNQKAGGLFKAGYYSNTDGYKASASLFGSFSENWSGLASYVYSEYGEIEDGEGNELEGSDTKQNVAFAKVVGEFEGGHTLRFSVEDLDESGNKLRRPEWAPGASNPLFPMDTARTTLVADWAFASREADWLDLRTKLSLTDGSVLQIGPWGPYEGDIQSVQLDLRNTQRFSGHELVYGIDYREDTVEAGSSDNPSEYSEDGEVFGIFIQDQYQATEALTLNLGARADFYRLHDQMDQDFSNEGFSPNVGATYAFTPEWRLTASAATAFRGPEINDAFRIDHASNDASLGAEKAQNYELRFTYDKDALSFEFGAYKNTIEDVISNTLPWSAVYLNVGDLETEGFFGRASYSTEYYNISLQYNNADTTLNDQIATRYQYGSLVSSIGNTWVLDAYWSPFAQFDMGWNTRLVEGIDGILIPEDISGVAGSAIDKPGYAIHDFYLRWSPEVIEGLTLNLTVKNLFDKFYRSHGSIEDLTELPGFGAVIGAPEPGRDIRVSASYHF